ncbi:unnamed protein product [Caenorhabditis angaria]|uniref:Nuclear Hormone Receptor family n=1 Tax=Caenorhabditis angaria TaxID=860376 RepID=A0A9P1IYY6_9PELO|nr:unnamed protein product [Caenorhabditis angaria]
MSAKIENCCSICDDSAHGTHFGVLSCRACAAFFRRTIVMKKKYICKKNHSLKQQCKFCRFQKCLKLGMTDDNVKLNYDTVIHTTKAPANTKKEVTYELETNKKGETRVKLDISELLKRVQKLLYSYKPPEFPKEFTSLQKMNLALIEYRRIHSSNIITFVSEISMREILGTSNDQLKSIAKFLIISEPYNHLSVNDKMKMLKCIWVQFKRLERYCSTAHIFGKRMYTERIVTIIPGVAACIDDLKIEAAHFIYRRAESMKFQMRDYNEKMMEEVAKPIVELELTPTEIAFMLTRMSWQVAGKQLQGDVLEKSEIALEKLDNDLHFYYMNEVKVVNYASRLIKIMNVLSSLQKIHYDRQNFMDLIRIFDAISVDVSDPELYKSYF